nr:mucin-4-like isoform X1 [Dermacentor andersoni]
MDPTARNALSLAALLILPLLQAYCPRLAPDVISGKVIPCRYLCIKINFFEMPSIVLSTERDGVLCSTLLLRRRGVCKNGGCVPFESEDQKPKGMFKRVITAIDKFASGSFRKTVPGPDAQFGPIVTVSPSPMGGGSKDTAGGTSERASGLTSSSLAAGTGAGPLVKAVGSTLTNIWTQAFPLNLKAPLPTRPFAAGKAPSNAPGQTLGGVTPGSSDRASVVDLGGGPPTAPPLLTGGSNNESPPSGTSQRSKLFGPMPGLASSLSLHRAITKLRGSNSASGVTSGSPSSPVGAINVVSAAGVNEVVSTTVGGTPRPNAVNVGGGPPTVPPLVKTGSKNEGPASETPRGKESSGILSGLTSTIGLSGILNTSHAKKFGTGLAVGTPSTFAAGINPGSVAVVNEGGSGTVDGTPRANPNLGVGLPNVTPITPQASGNENMFSETPRESGLFGGMSRLRSRLAVNRALNKLKNRKHEPGVAPASPSSPAGGTKEGSAAVINRAASGPVGGTSQGNDVNISVGLPVSPLSTTESNDRRPASDTPQGAESAVPKPGLTSAIGLALKTSPGKDSEPGAALGSPASSTDVRNVGIARVMNQAGPGAIDKTMGANENFTEGLPPAAPLTTPSNRNRSVASEVPQEAQSSGAISTLLAKETLAGARKKLLDENSASNIVSVSLNSPAVGTSEATATVTTAGASAPSVAAGGTSLAPFVESTRRPATVSVFTEKKAQQVPKMPSDKTEGSHLPPEILGGPEAATPPVTRTSGLAVLHEAARPPLIATGQATPVSILAGASPHAPSLSVPARRIFGGIAGAASTLVRRKEGRTLLGTSTNGASPPDAALPTSKHSDTSTESSQADKNLSNSSLKPETSPAPLVGPTSGGSLGPRRFISNFLGRRRRRSLSA